MTVGLIACLAALLLAGVSASPAFADETGAVTVVPTSDSQSGGATADQGTGATAGDTGGETPGDASGDSGAVIAEPDPVAEAPSPAGPAQADPPQQPAASDPAPEDTPSQPIGEGQRHTAPSDDAGSGHQSSPASSAAGTTPAPPGDSLGAAGLPAVPVQPLSADAGGASFIDTGAARLLSAKKGLGCGICRSGARLFAVGLGLPRGARPADRREAQERAAGMAAEATAPSLLGVPGSGPGLFSLLIGGAGGAVTTAFVGFLAVLAAALLLAQDWMRAFRLPGAVWRPATYVTPLELPG